MGVGNCDLRERLNGGKNRRYENLVKREKVAAEREKVCERLELMREKKLAEIEKEGEKMRKRMREEVKEQEVVLRKKIGEECKRIAKLEGLVKKKSP